MKHILAQDFNKTNPEAPLIEASYYFKFYVVRAMDHAAWEISICSIFSHGATFCQWASLPGPKAWGRRGQILTRGALILPITSSRLLPAFNPQVLASKRCASLRAVGSLTTANATYLHPQGKFSARYTVASGKLNAIVELPPGLPEHVSHSTSQPLHPGHNEINLPVAKLSARKSAA